MLAGVAGFGSVAGTTANSTLKDGSGHATRVPSVVIKRNWSLAVAVSDGPETSNSKKALEPAGTSSSSTAAMFQAGQIPAAYRGLGIPWVLPSEASQSWPRFQSVPPTLRKEAQMVAVSPARNDRG